MIDEARRGTIFYRIVLSPAPKQEDRYKDLNLRDLTLDTMLRLEERLGKPVQFVATIHDDHAPHRHVHTLVLVQGRRLTREDFQALRLEATERALSQRRLLDRIRGYHLQRSRIPRRFHHARQAGRGRVSWGVPPYQSYTCFLCGYHQALPASPQGYRCPACGLKMRRNRADRFRLPRRQERGLSLALSLSP
jgi:DNA-directed RNA polymerase subunit RPC12/RpoP